MSVNRVNNPPIITGDNIVASSVGASQIATGAVNTDEIADGAIVTADLALGCISGNSIVANSIQQGHVLSGYVSLFGNQIVSGSKSFADPIRFSGFNVTGNATATVGNNCPGVVSGTPYIWFTVYAQDGSQVFIPAWK